MIVNRLYDLVKKVDEGNVTEDDIEYVTNFLSNMKRYVDNPKQRYITIKERKYITDLLSKMIGNSTSTSIGDSLKCKDKIICLLHQFEEKK